MENHCFFQNKNCEYYPCHSDVSENDFNCMFCFCPLYLLGDKCGGNYKYIEDGKKDCSACIIPHKKESYDYIIEKMSLICEIVKKK